MAHDSILEELGTGGSRVFDVEVSKDGRRFELREACDGYFHHELTRLELMLLGMELIELALGLGKRGTTQ
jgi:hypothetical protein